MDLWHRVSDRLLNCSKINQGNKSASHCSSNTATMYPYVWYYNNIIQKLYMYQHYNTS
uniref:Uncharacterized protein n=1 Tax=Solanum tuberosum TaxID=4113 RepID=M1CPJ8_SOLTU